MAKWNVALRKTDLAVVHDCPRVSVVLGDVIDIGESALRFADRRADIPFERVS